jgi:hypothetical protein
MAKITLKTLGDANKEVLSDEYFYSAAAATWILPLLAAAASDW